MALGVRELLFVLVHGSCSSTSRLPFVSGIDRYLPQALGRVHAKWGTPWIAVIFYGGARMLCAVLSQAGSSVQSAYDLLVRHVRHHVLYPVRIPTPRDHTDCNASPFGKERRGFREGSLSPLSLLRWA